jgi:hypothetical protein
MEYFLWDKHFVAWFCNKCGTNAFDKQQAPDDPIADHILVYSCVRPE